MLRPAGWYAAVSCLARKLMSRHSSLSISRFSSLPPAPTGSTAFPVGLERTIAPAPRASGHRLAGTRDRVADDDTVRRPAPGDTAGFSRTRHQAPGRVEEHPADDERDHTRAVERTDPRQERSGTDGSTVEEASDDVDGGVGVATVSSADEQAPIRMLMASSARAPRLVAGQVWRHGTNGAGFRCWSSRWARPGAPAGRPAPWGRRHRTHPRCRRSSTGSRMRSRRRARRGVARRRRPGRRGRGAG